MNSSQPCTDYLPSIIESLPRKRSSTLYNDITLTLGSRLADEAVLIPRRTAIVERLHEREQQIEDGGENE
jgi:hypothetical protein